VRPDLVELFAVDGSSMETVFVGVCVSAIDDGEACGSDEEMNLKAQ
jgi:hypothetical protein